MERLFKAIEDATCVAAMTGAGVSTLCGIPDFRGPQGLYKNPDAERIFDIDWFDRDPSIYYRGCRELVYGLDRFRPGPVHLALKRLEERGGLPALDEGYVPRCACGGVYKPDITFFGESLPEEAFVRSQELAMRADVMLVLGTSLTVFPAAGLPRLTLQRGGKVFIVNAQPTPLDEFAVARYEDLAAFAKVV